MVHERVMNKNIKKGVWGYNFYEVGFSSKNCKRLKDLVIFELRFGFLMKNFIYGQMETSGDPHLSRKVKKLHFRNKICSNQIIGVNRPPAPRTTAVQKKGS